MSSTNYRSTRAYARRMLMREKQRIGPTTPSTGSKRRVSISLHMSCICPAYANHVRSAARLPRVTARSHPRRLHAVKAVGLLCTCPAYAPLILIFNIGGRKTTGVSGCCGGGESSSKSSSFYCVCYVYALHKPLQLWVEPAARPA